MLSKTNKRQNGFTIIEVLIVLAIAGLIMLIVFLAVPALQRNARNTQRRSDVSALLGGATEYVNNNNGSLPTGWDSTNVQITGGGSNSANVKLGYYAATNVTVTGTAATSNAGDAEKVTIVVGGKCSGSDSVSGGPSRGFVALYTLEGGSSGAKICQAS